MKNTYGLAPHFYSSITGLSGIQNNNIYFVYGEEIAGSIFNVEDPEPEPKQELKIGDWPWQS